MAPGPKYFLVTLLLIVQPEFEYSQYHYITTTATVQRIKTTPKFTRLVNTARFIYCKPLTENHAVRVKPVKAFTSITTFMCKEKKKEKNNNNKTNLLA